MREEFLLHGTIKNEFLGERRIDFESGLNIVLGGNGSGKSTLLKYICGLRKNKETILLNEQKIKERDLSFFFSGDILGEVEMTIKENIIYYVGWQGIRSNYKRYTELMKCLELINYENVLLRNASEGMRQKMSIIMCLLSNAPIKVLDEPFNYMDEKSCIGLVSYLCEYVRNYNDIIIIATNDVNVFNNSNEANICEIRYVSL